VEEKPKKREKSAKRSPLEGPEYWEQAKEVKEILALKDKWREKKHRVSNFLQCYRFFANRKSAKGEKKSIFTA
jgi:hypothetical protein